MAWRTRIQGLGLVLGAAVMAQACAQTHAQQPSAGAASPAANGECRERIIVTFATAAETDTVSALAVSAGVKLAVVNRLLPTTFVLDMTAADCGLAIARLRAAVGVRAVEPDARRRSHRE